jgi:DNA polymerase-4
LPARRINGIGPKSNIKLEALGIRTIGDIAQKPVDWLIENFGERYGRWLARVAIGEDERPVVTYSEPRSISRETTFERDLDTRRDRDELSRILISLCDRLGGDLARKGYVARGIGIKIRYSDFRIVTRDSTLDAPVDDAQSILAAARTCLKRVSFDRRLRLLGVKASSLLRASEVRLRTAEPPTADASGLLKLFD